MPFDPLNLTPSASLNRARIVDLPGLALDPDVRGRTGFELLGAESLAAAIGEHAAAPGLQHVAKPDALLPAFDRCLTAEDEAVREAALALARRFGRSLGYLLLMLHRGDPVNRAARQDWDDSYWACWAGIRTVWLGGGIVSGHLSAQLRHNAADVLRESGAAQPTVEVARHPRVLPLIGAARSLPAPAAPALAETAVVFDFGGTSIKRALATYARGALARLTLLPPLATAQLGLTARIGPPLDTQTASALAGVMADVMARTWEDAAQSDGAPTAHLVASLANYVCDGVPIPAQAGVYTDLCALPQPAPQYLGRLLSTRLGQDVGVTLLHDGTAAARTYAGTPHGAVIMLGTALGVGYAPESAAALRPLAPTFTVANAG